MYIKLNKSTIIDTEAINYLAINYSILDYHVNLVALLKTVYPDKDFEGSSKYELHKLLSDTLLQNYSGEEIHKYNLFEQQLNKRNMVGAFEMNVNNSRVDFLTINGYTTSYEIKSELDTLSKVSKQMTDYMLAFEYNYLVVDERHVEKAFGLLPKNCGLWSYKDGAYYKLKTAKLSEKINPKVQLKLLSKKELLNIYPQENGRIEKILATNPADGINRKFKKILKSRYKKRWEFLVSNKKNILPIDISFFFNTNVLPNNIYLR